MLAQIQQQLEEKFHQEAIDNAEVLDKTPPEFFVKAILLIVGVVAISLIVKKMKDK